jgi:hypothetical protein
MAVTPLGVQGVNVSGAVNIIVNYARGYPDPAGGFAARPSSPRGVYQAGPVWLYLGSKPSLSVVGGVVMVFARQRISAQRIARPMVAAFAAERYPGPRHSGVMSG